MRVIAGHSDRAPIGVKRFSAPEYIVALGRSVPISAEMADRRAGSTPALRRTDTRAQTRFYKFAVAPEAQDGGGLFFGLAVVNLLASAGTDSGAENAADIPNSPSEG